MPDRAATARGQRLALLGLGANLALAAIKLAAGVLGHSYALVADAVESLLDVVGSAVIWGGLRYGAKPADREHPYGHGRAETIAALVVALIILAAGVGIAIESVREILTPHRAPAWWTLLVLACVVAVKEGLFRVVHLEGSLQSSDALHTDAWHHRSDAITSAAAFLGVGVAVLGGPVWADDAAALFASGVIVFNAARLLRRPFRDLMDTTAPDVAQRAADVAAADRQVDRVEQAHARRIGRRFWIDMHLEVDPAMRVDEAHRVTGRVKEAIRADDPRVTNVLIHVEPHDPTPPPTPPPTPSSTPPPPPPQPPSPASPPVPPDPPASG